MSFLDVLKKKDTDNTTVKVTTTKIDNPFKKLTADTSAKENPLNMAVNPFAKLKVPKTSDNKIDINKTEAEDVKLEEKPALVANEEKADVSADLKKEIDTNTDTQVNNKEEDNKTVETEQKTDTKNEDKGKRKIVCRKKRTYTKESNNESVDTVSGQGDGTLYNFEYQDLDIFGMKMNFTEAIKIVMSQYIDKDFIEFRDKINKKLQDIAITNDMNSGVLKYALESLNIINDEISLPLEEAKALITVLSDKESGVGTVIKTIAASESSGSNLIARNASGFRALTTANVNGHEINLLVMLIAAKVRFNFLEAIKNKIEFKRNLLITMNGALKLEADLTK